MHAILEPASSVPNLLAAIALSGCLHGCGPLQPAKDSPVDVSNVEEAWNANNDPRRLRSRYEVRLNALPGSGSIRTATPWTDTYWPTYKGGLSQRWNDPSSPDAFSYTPAAEAVVRGMSQAQLARLSPAEKYDIYNGRFDYPLLTSERERTSPDAPTWYGLCHGWAPASIAFHEPGAVAVVGPSGITVPFGASDVKALLTYTQQAPETRTGARVLGERCNADLTGDPSRSDEPQCRDTNAGSFHILVANTIGVEGTPLLADFQRDLQVWNHPMIGFNSRVIGQTSLVPATAAPGTVHIVSISTTVRYVGGLGPSWNRVPADRYPQQISSRVYQYSLELNASGEIIGGEWISDSRPDFLWSQQAPRFVDYFSGVGAIYNASIAR